MVRSTLFALLFLIGGVYGGVISPCKPSGTALGCFCDKDGSVSNVLLNCSGVGPLLRGTLDLSNIGLTNITEGSFEKMTSLTELDLARNKLTALSATIFSNFTFLHYLSLSNNDIAFYPATIFENLQNVKNMILSENYVITTLPATIFHNMRSLEKLHLRLYMTVTLPATIFDKLTRLYQLTLNVATLPATIFDNLPNLLYLYLDRTYRITTLPATIFDKLTSLKQLWLRDNPWDCTDCNVKIFGQNLAYIYTAQQYGVNATCAGTDIDITTGANDCIPTAPTPAPTPVPAPIPAPVPTPLPMGFCGTLWPIDGRFGYATYDICICHGTTLVDCSYIPSSYDQSL